MRNACYGMMLLIIFSAVHCQQIQGSDSILADPPAEEVAVARKTGSIASDLLVECSGIDVSMVRGDLLWAINDSGDGPYLYAMGTDGRDRGRVWIIGAANRDWEDLATFRWQDRPMILVADIGDNREHHGTHRLYIVEEPRLSGERFDASVVAKVAWTITFCYPDRAHDAEAVAADPTTGQILILTKRDTPPVLFGLPLKPESTDTPLTARRLAAIDKIPPPTVNDVLYPYGKFRSQPTAMDLSPDGQKMVVLTYKHAYLFSRSVGDAWEGIAGVPPIVLPLPLPQNIRGFDQREAACFTRAVDGLFITAEGQHAAIYRFDIDHR